MSLGKNIKKRRKELKMTQKELSNGICTQSQISKIEKEETIPLSNLLQSIAMRLESSIDDLYDENSSGTKYIINKTKYNNLLRCYDYPELEREILKFKEMDLGFEDTIYIKYLNLIIRSELYQENTVEEMKKLLKKNLTLISDELHVNILNSLGIFLLDQGQPNYAAEYLEEAYSIVFIKHLDNDLTVKVIYSYLRLLLFIQDYKKLFEEASNAINFSFNNNVFIYIAEFIYFKHLSLELLNSYQLADEQEMEFAKYMAKNQRKLKILNKLTEINKI